jgi:hypothetical protein
LARRDVIEARVAKLIGRFGDYVQAYDDRVPFTGEQLAAHRHSVEIRRQAGSVRAAIENREFVTSLRRTLLAWGVGRRASRLAAEGDFAAALNAVAPRLEEIEPLTIDADDLPEDISDRLWLIIDSLGVVTNKAKLVAGTKTLHHLLPDLIPPMDRAWTGAFFQFHLPEWQDLAGQRRIFRIAYSQFIAVARHVHPQRYVTGAGWRTSRTKILDNALIGFCKAELGSSPLVAEDAANQVSFEVTGYPPAKNEALSMLGVGHSHAPRVRMLLEAARQARSTQGFVPISSGGVALEVVVRAPAGQNPADATNYLGGIADVLEDKSHRGDLIHLGDLALIWLYGNDRQIKEVTYREADADEVSYSVTVRELSYQAESYAQASDPR